MNMMMMMMMMMGDDDDDDDYDYDYDYDGVVTFNAQVAQLCSCKMKAMIMDIYMLSLKKTRCVFWCSDTWWTISHYIPYYLPRFGFWNTKPMPGTLVGGPKTSLGWCASDVELARPRKVSNPVPGDFVRCRSTNRLVCEISNRDKVELTCNI